MGSEFFFECVREIYISRIGLPILLQGNMWIVDRSWDYTTKSLTDTWL
jgi:hypothetical protein